MAKRLTVGDVGRVVFTGELDDLHAFNEGQTVKIVKDERDWQPYLCVDAETGNKVHNGWLFEDQIETIEAGVETWEQLTAETVKDLRKGDIIRTKLESSPDMTQGKEYTIIEDSYVDFFGDTVADFLDDVGDLAEVNTRNAVNTEVKRVSA